jgi:integrase/recombinase XerD
MNTSLILTSSLPLDQNPAAVYIASLGSPSGRRSQAQALRVIAQIMGSDLASVNWSALRYQHTAAIRTQLMQAYKPATANKILSALKQTLKHAWLLGQMSVDDYMRAVKLDPIAGETLPAGRYLSGDEIKAMMDVCKQDENRNAGIRDAAMIALMYIALLRREGVANLRVEDYHPSTGELVVIEKRSKERTDYIENGAREALHAWLKVRGDTPGALFVAVSKTGKITGYDHFTPQTVYNMIQKRSEQAGVENNSPHNFRRTGASDYLAADVDVLTVSKLGGWADVRTLKRYDRRPEEAKKKAASKLHIPY